MDIQHTILLNSEVVTPTSGVVMTVTVMEAVGVRRPTIAALTTDLLKSFYVERRLLRLLRIRTDVTIDAESRRHDLNFELPFKEISFYLDQYHSFILNCLYTFFASRD